MRGEKEVATQQGEARGEGGPSLTFKEIQGVSQTRAHLEYGEHGGVVTWSLSPRQGEGAGTRAVVGGVGGGSYHTTAPPQGRQGGLGEEGTMH